MIWTFSLDILMESLDKYPSSLPLLFNFTSFFKMAKIFEGSRVLKYMILIKNTNVLHSLYFGTGKLLNEDFLNNQLAHCYEELSANPHLFIILRI